MRIRTWSKLAVATVAVGMLASCATGSNQSADDDVEYDRDAALTGNVQIMGFGGVDEIATTRYDRAVEALGTDVDVNLIEGNLDMQQFLSAVAAGDPPALVYANRDQIGSLAARGAIIPLDNCIAGEEIDTDQYLEAALDQVTFDGKVYGIPEFNTVQLTMANADLLAAAGLELDDVNGSDWDAITAAAEAMMQSTGGKLSVIGVDTSCPSSSRYGRSRTVSTSSRKTVAPHS